MMSASATADKSFGCQRSWLFVGLLIGLRSAAVQSQDAVRSVEPPFTNVELHQITGSYVIYGPGNSTNVTSYRTLTLHDGKLFVGAKNRLFSVNTTNLDTLADVGIPPTSGSDCEYCQNYISVIKPLTNGALLVCGSNSLNPYCRQRSPENLSIAGPTHDFITGRETPVPFVPHQNFSWLLVNDTADDNYKIFVGITLVSTSVGDLKYPSIVRASMVANSSMTAISIGLRVKSNILLGSQFVGDPIDYNGRVYFFFRELAKEHASVGPIVYSRVGVVCKNDKGGVSASPYEGDDMVTFVKARLECSILGGFPYHYNSIRDIYQSTVHETVVFAVFATSVGVTASAVCAYRLDEIERLFLTESPFLASENAGELWRKVDPDPVAPRQATCPDSTSYNSAQYTAILRLAQLMDDTVENRLDYEAPGKPKSSPLLLTQGEHFTQIVVDENVLGSMDVMFIGTERGAVLKAYLSEDKSQARVVERINLNADSQAPVLTLLKSDSDQAVFAGTEDGVFKIPLQHCQDFTTLPACLDASDPYCRWTNDSGCRYSNEEGLQDLENGYVGSDNAEIIDILTRPKTETWKRHGQPLNLYLVGETAAGKNLAVVGGDIPCGPVPCASLPYDSSTHTSSGREFLVVYINASLPEKRNCSCSCTLVNDDGVTEVVNFTLRLDNSVSMSEDCKDCQDQIAAFDNGIAQYKQKMEKWYQIKMEVCGLVKNELEICR